MTEPGVRRAGSDSDEVTRWIAEHAYPLALLDAAAPSRDLERLDSIVDHAVVVGLARPTHGAHELSTLTHRILRYLVEALGFRTLAIEEDWTTGVEIDRHLRSGHGDPLELLRNASPQWQNEELLDVLRWLRGWNERHPDDHVRIVGLDVSSVRPVAHDAIADHVRRHAPDRLDELEAHLSVLRPTAGVADHTERFAALADKALLEHGHRTYDLVEGLPAGDDQAFALQHARVIVAYHELHAIEPAVQMTYLEARLAENLIWWHDHTGHKILYWSGSHSAVGDARGVDFGPNTSSETSRNAGSYLRAHFGARYRSGGLTLHHGTIRLDATTQLVPEPPPGRPDAVLGDAGLDRLLLDLRSDHPPPVVRAWLEAPARFRLIGPGYRPVEDAGHHMHGGSLADWFDFLIHHHQVTPTRSLA